MRAYCRTRFHNRGRIEMVRANAIYDETASPCQLIKVLLFHRYNNDA